MANPVDPKMTAELLRERIALLNAENAAMTASTVLSDARAEQLSKYIGQLRQLANSVDQLTEKQVFHDKMAEDLGKTTARGKEQLKEAKRIKELVVAIKSQSAEMKKAVSGSTKLAKRLREVGTRAVPLAKQLKTAAGAQEDWNKNVFNSASTEPVFKRIHRVGTAAFHGISTVLESTTAQMVALAAFMPSVSFRAFKAEMAGMANAYDRGFRGIMKAGYNFTDEMEGVFLSTFDVRGGLKTGVLGLETANRMLVGLGITATDSSKAFLALKENAMFFTAKNIKENQAFTAEVANMYAGLSKLGVNFADSSKAFDVFTKSLQQAPRQALTSTKRLIKIADSLDISVGKAFRDFNQLMPTLAQFGDQAVEVFGKLEAQARATGIQVGVLSKMAQGLDTFKGAAKAAQGLNAVLGGTFISMADLVHADPAEKINIIRQAFARAGVDFSTTHRRVKQLVASLLGVDPQTATRLLGSKEQYDTITGSLKTTAATTDEMREKLSLQMTAAERLKAKLGHLGLGMSKLVRIAHKTARQTANALEKGFFRMETDAKSADKAVIALGLSLKLLQKGAGIRHKGVVAGGVLGVLQSLSKEDRERVMERAAKEAGAAGKVTLDIIKEVLNSMGLNPFAKLDVNSPIGTNVESRLAGKGKGGHKPPAHTAAEEALITLAAAIKAQSENLKIPIVIENKLMLNGEVLASSMEPGVLDLLKRIFS